MHKRLLLQFLGLTCAMGAFAAYSSGDYVFTTDARYKITSETNLMTNGEFSTTNFDSSDFGWKNADGSAVSSDKWQIAVGEGPDGCNALKSLSAASDDPVIINSTASFSASQTLVISFKVKTPVATGIVTTSTTSGEEAYVDVYANSDGTTTTSTDNRYQQVASAVAIGTDWTEVSYCFEDTVTGGSTGYIVVALGRLPEGALIADFSIQEASSVYDTRISDRALAYAQWLVDSGEFTEGASDFQTETIDVIKEYVQDPNVSDDPSSMEELMGNLIEARDEWLDKSSTNYLTEVNSNAQISATWSKYNYKTLSSLYGWTFEGGRWGHSTGSEYVANDMPGSYHLGTSCAYLTKTGAPASRYMFAIDAMGLKYAAKKVNGGWYGEDLSYNLPYVKVFVGKDTTTWDSEVVPNTYYNTYTAFGEIAEGDTLRAGIFAPEFGESTDHGGSFRIKNAILRRLGISKADGERQALVASIYTQQQELKKRFGYAQADMDSTLASWGTSAYPWGRQSLTDSVTKYTELYNASLAYVNEEGVDQGIDIPEGYDDTVLAWVRAMNTSRNNLKSLNEPYSNVVEYVPTAQAKLDGEAYANASADCRTALQNAVDNASSLIKSVTSTTDSATFADAYTAMKDAVYKFEHSCVTVGNPANEAVVNPYFDGNGDGWTMTGQSDNGRWKYRSGDGLDTTTGWNRFENATCVGVDRGYTAYSKNKAIQKITISMSGLYEFRCQAYAYNQNSSTYSGMWNGLSGEDSLMVTGIALFFGPEDNPDSLTNICTTQTTFGEIYTPDEIRTYSILYNKAADGDEVVEFGMDAMNNLGCAIYGFGSVHVYYWQTEDIYESGISDVPVDVLKNKQDTSVYNLMGVKVANSKADLQKGVYISNGKKFVVK